MTSKTLAQLGVTVLLQITLSLSDLQKHSSRVTKMVLLMEKKYLALFGLRTTASMKL